MKRFLELVLLALAIALGSYFVLYHTSIPLPFLTTDEPQALYRAQGTQLQRADGDEWEELRLRGVELSPAIPGHHASDYAATTEDYERWFVQIDELGANTIMVTQLMDDEFYTALATHNAEAEEPLFLLQGIMAESEYEQAAQDAYDSGLKDRLIKQARIVVDAIHGHRDVVTSGIGGTGTYRDDVSPWVVGYLVADQLDADMVAYTNHSLAHTGGYQGSYFETADDATVFEAMLAEVMDAVVAYETDSYAEQRPVGFASGALTDFLEYDRIYATQLRKYVQLDAEKILCTANNHAGQVAAYRLDELIADFGQYLSPACQAILATQLPTVDLTSSNAYLELLRAHHQMPVLGFFSASSSRGASNMGIAPIDETGQGEALRATSQSIEDADWNGQIISTWQDVWSRRSWNTAYATSIDNAHLWHDVQTATQCEGLLAFDPGKKPVCVVDGNASEWDDDVVAQSDGMSVSARYDARGLYLLVQGVSAAESAYVAIDVSPEVGVSSCDDPALSFDRDAEFVLCLEGEQNSRLLVQQRYDSTRQMFLSDIERIDPFVEVVEADTTTFVVPTLCLSNHTLVDDLGSDASFLRRSGTWETGRLTHGNADPDSSSYNSLADFCYGSNCVELRLPWLLLNVGDPPNMAVHRDYYEHYGVELRGIGGIALGVSDGMGTDPIVLNDFAMMGWTSVRYTERLKQSYDIMRDAWRKPWQGGDAR